MSHCNTRATNAHRKGLPSHSLECVKRGYLLQRRKVQGAKNGWLRHDRVSSAANHGAFGTFLFFCCSLLKCCRPETKGATASIKPPSSLHFSFRIGTAQPPPVNQAFTSNLAARALPMITAAVPAFSMISSMIPPVKQIPPQP